MRYLLGKKKKREGRGREEGVKKEGKDHDNKRKKAAKDYQLHIFLL